MSALAEQLATPWGGVRKTNSSYLTPCIANSWLLFHTKRQASFFRGTNKIFCECAQKRGINRHQSTCRPHITRGLVKHEKGSLWNPSKEPANYFLFQKSWLSSAIFLERFIWLVRSTLTLLLICSSLSTTQIYTSWWFQPIRKILVKLDHFPR